MKNMAMAKQWNPMADAYGNREFNTYQQGPGANLDDSHQPGALANSLGRSAFKLCLKGVPGDMNPQGVRNLCSAYGKVTDVHISTRTPYIFVSFATLNDMERAMTGLKENPHGISADFAKEAVKHSAGSDSGKDENKNPASSANTTTPNQPDMSRRSIKGPFTNPPRPQPFRKQPLVTLNDYENSELKNVDPQKHFLIQHDIHDGDRNKPKEENSMGGKQMHTGRPYYKEPKDTTDQIRRLSESSKGSYNPQKNEYVHQLNVAVNGGMLGSCMRCSKPANKVCQRCEDYYCSVECQKKDWPKHRYICFQMPQLVPPHSSNIGVSLPEKAPNLTKPSSQNNQQLQERTDFKPTTTNASSQKNQQQQSRVDPRRQPNQQNKGQTNMKQPNNQQNRQQTQIAKEPQQKKKETVKEPEPPKPRLKRLKMADIPASGSTVAVTAITKFNKVYIRSLAPADNVEYIKILNMINTEAKKCEVIQKMPERGDILVSEFQDTGFYRVIVLGVEQEEHIIVAYVDFGNTEMKKKSELRELPEAARDCLRYTLPVELKDVPDFQGNDSVLAYLNSLADLSGVELKMIYDKLENGVELIDLSTNDNVNKKILGMLKVDVPTDADPPIMSSQIEMRLLPDGDNVHVYVFDNSFLQTGCISCIHENDILKLEGFNKQIQEYAEKTTETYTPREQELCLVKYEEDGIWYRAECIEVVGDGHPSVLFIDYGNVTLSKIENIRKFPKEFVHPCFTSSCLIKDIPEELSDKAVQRLNELIPINEKLILDKVVRDPENEINEVSINKVVDKLKAENLI